LAGNETGEVNNRNMIKDEEPPTADYTVFRSYNPFGDDPEKGYEHMSIIMHNAPKIKSSLLEDLEDELF